MLQALLLKFLGAEKPLAGKEQASFASETVTERVRASRRRACACAPCALREAEAGHGTVNKGWDLFPGSPASVLWIYTLKFCYRNVLRGWGARFRVTAQPAHPDAQEFFVPPMPTALQGQCRGFPGRKRRSGQFGYRGLQTGSKQRLRA